ncbi:hypothetical protein HanRHA438_Chr09g0401161 [Helianthus annuus]|nr:hypothetical protein HanIR_Chr09g0420111 [Helianthus annuus]KAJ0888356.1 hypothetical protein HanRHA438_Chr09g0401161 [Helianthus annuus]
MALESYQEKLCEGKLWHLVAQRMIGYSGGTSTSDGGCERCRWPFITEQDIGSQPY